MISKIIHYCWFGKNEKPKSVLKCIKSWKKFCPDYQIIEWNEENYDIEKCCKFVTDAYKNKKWAFVSDYVRLDVVYKYGGIYLDTDVELIKSIDDLVYEGRGYFGFERKEYVASGLGFSCEKGEQILYDMMKVYDNLIFDIEKLSDFACPIINTSILVRYGMKCNGEMQIINGIKILPVDFLCPENFYSGKCKYTNNTISIHHYNGSWMSIGEKIKTKVIILVKRLLLKIN